MALSDIKSEIPRTFFHTLGGFSLALIGYFPSHPLNLYLLAAVFGTALTAEVLRLLVPSVKQLASAIVGPFMRPSEENRLTGALPFTGGVLLAFLLFSKPVALSAMVPLVFGDRAGLLVGKSIGKIRIGEKTFEGCLGCFLVTLAAYLVLGWGWQGIFPYPLMVLIGASIVGTVAEALPRPFDDNLTIPIAVGVFLSMVA